MIFPITICHFPSPKIGQSQFPFLPLHDRLHIVKDAVQSVLRMRILGTPDRDTNFLTKLYVLVI